MICTPSHSGLPFQIEFSMITFEQNLGNYSKIYPRWTGWLKVVVTFFFSLRGDKHKKLSKIFVLFSGSVADSRELWHLVFLSGRRAVGQRRLMGVYWKTGVGEPLISHLHRDEWTLTLEICKLETVPGYWGANSQHFQINEKVLNLEDQMAYFMCLESSQEFFIYITFCVEFRRKYEYAGGLNFRAWEAIRCGQLMSLLDG